MQNKNIRVRFAPSPTGYLHVGNARTALFNWLFARKYRGHFILRIEDTDQERVRPEYEQAIIEDLQWLGLHWDEGPVTNGVFGPYRQSERHQLYIDAAEKMVQSGHAYYCYCTAEELEQQRKEFLAAGKPPRYRGDCALLTDKQRQAYEREGRKPSIRFRPADTGTIQVNDLVHGVINIEQELLGDFIILRSNQMAAYNLAVVIDDALMQVSHVIRGEDHLPNTPRQQLLYEALGYPLPTFVHLPMILGSDRTMLSKRHGATSVRQFQKQGFLPQALVNYLALLGWSPGEERELLSMEELIEAFNLSHLAKGAAVFDQAKLSWMNAHYIRGEEIYSLTQLCLPYLKEAGYLAQMPQGEKLSWLHSVIEAVRPNLTQLDQVAHYALPFFCDDFTLDSEALPIAREGIRVIEELSKILSQGPHRYSEQDFQEIIKSIQLATGMKGKKLYMPIRIALSGSLKGPELQHLCLLLTREHCQRRVHNSLRQLEG